MNLRSGRVLGSRASDIASQATTREIGARSVGNLESIQEGSSTDSQSDTFSQGESKMGNNVDMNQDRMRRGKFTDNPFDDPNGEMDFNVQLTFQYINAYGAQMYKDH